MLKRICSIFFVLLIFVISKAVSYRILALALMVTPSHKITMDPLLDELAKRGHHVTVVSPLPPKKTIAQMREIQTLELSKYLQLPNIFEMKARGEKVQPIYMLTSYAEVCLQSLTLPQVESLREETFDLIILPVIFNECGGALSLKYFPNVPMILFSPVSAPTFLTTYYGNPSPPSFIPFLFSHYSQEMSFSERCSNFIQEASVRWLVNYIAYPEIARQYRRILQDPSLPSVEDFFKRTSLILSNSHFSITNVRPFLPNIVEVGGLHCSNPKPLEQELEVFVNGSGLHGFILFSLGTALRTSDLPKAKIVAITSTFAKLPHRILWKSDINLIPGLPDNVKLSNWVPQQDLLGHPKIRLLITHGGFGSTTEAIYHGVPIIGIPLFSDQDMNMKWNENSGIGLRIDFNNLTEASFSEAIHNVLQNSKFRENVRSLSSKFRDQPEPPLERAVYWTEYVIRHKGAHHLKSTGADLNFYQYHSLDVIATLLLLAVISITLSMLSLFIIARKIKQVFSTTDPLNAKAKRN